MNNLIEEAFSKLYPGKEFYYKTKIKYSNKLKPYNGLIKKRGIFLEFVLSKKWEGIEEEILMGLIQILLLKMLKGNKTTINIDLYNNFIKSLHYAVKKEHADIILDNSFNRVNEKYFYGLIEKPNLKWGRPSKRTLAYYDYHTDTITVSNLFLDVSLEVLDYLIYHELLHKKLKFYNKDGKNYHHTKSFRRLENKFQDYQKISNDLDRFIKTKSTKYF